MNKGGKLSPPHPVYVGERPSDESFISYPSPLAQAAIDSIARQTVTVRITNEEHVDFVEPEPDPAMVEALQREAQAEFERAMAKHTEYLTEIPTTTRVVSGHSTPTNEEIRRALDELI